MSISTGRNLVLGAIMATSMTACKHSFKEAKNVEPFTQELVDSISKYTSTVLKDKTYKCFGKDTLALGKDFEINPERFLRTMNDSAESKVPKRVVDSRLVLVNMPWGQEVKNHVIKEPVYKDTKAVVRTPQIFTDGKKNYVPVEYYGK